MCDSHQTNKNTMTRKNGTTNILIILILIFDIFKCYTHNGNTNLDITNYELDLSHLLNLILMGGYFDLLLL
jgi:hypothetical protein